MGPKKKHTTNKALLGFVWELRGRQKESNFLRVLSQTTPSRVKKTANMLFIYSALSLSPRKTAAVAP